MLLVFFADARWVGLVVFMLIYVAGSFVQLEASERCYINLVGAIDHTALCVSRCVASFVLRRLAKMSLPWLPCRHATYFWT